MPTTATITPTLGSAPVTLQAGNYSAIDDRRAWSFLTSEYAYDLNSYKVVQRAAGANMTVDVQSSSGGALVQGDSVTAQGHYTIPQTATNVNVDIAAADATNPRNDLVVLEVKDDQHDASGLNLARVRVITGTPNASAALTSDYGVNGTPALPSSCLPLAVVRVAAGATSITNAAINDRRSIAPVTTWRDWTPTLTNITQGNGTVDARYCIFGKIVFFYFQFALGSTSAMGTNPTISTPNTLRAAKSAQITGIANDFGTGIFNLMFDTSTTAISLYAQNTAGNYASAQGLSATIPMTWATNDGLYIAGTYEAA